MKNAVGSISLPVNMPALSEKLDHDRYTSHHKLLVNTAVIFRILNHTHALGKFNIHPTIPECNIEHAGERTFRTFASSLFVPRRLQARLEQ